LIDSIISTFEDSIAASDDETTIGSESTSRTTRGRLLLQFLGSVVGVSVVSPSEDDAEMVEVERCLFRIAILCLRANAASLVAMSCVAIAMSKSAWRTE